MRRQLVYIVIAIYALLVSATFVAVALPRRGYVKEVPLPLMPLGTNADKNNLDCSYDYSYYNLPATYCVAIHPQPNWYVTFYSPTLRVSRNSHWPSRQTRQMVGDFILKWGTPERISMNKSFVMQMAWKDKGLFVIVRTNTFTPFTQAAGIWWEHEEPSFKDEWRGFKRIK